MTIRLIMEAARDDILDPSEFPHTAEEINNGNCADWATVVWERLRDIGVFAAIEDDESLAGHDYSHTFIYYDGRYYDAECIEGVVDWIQLPTFLRELVKEGDGGKALLFANVAP